jgi:hypothetical protein
MSAHALWHASFACWYELTGQFLNQKMCRKYAAIFQVYAKKKDAQSQATYAKKRQKQSAQTMKKNILNCALKAA